MANKMHLKYSKSHHKRDYFFLDTNMRTSKKTRIKRSLKKKAQREMNTDLNL